MLQWTSCLSEYMDPFCRELNGWFQRAGSLSAEFYDPHWDIRQSAMATGELQGGFICGLLYVWGIEQGWRYEPMVAPVMASSHQGTAAYYADIIVRQDSSFATLADLEGHSFAVNEYQSFSGYHMLSAAMAPATSPQQYFDEIQLSGSHWQSLQLIASRQVDCAAIDSTLMSMVAQREPERVSPFRSVAQIGPFPAPPFVVCSDLGQPSQKITLGLIHITGGQC